MEKTSAILSDKVLGVEGVHTVCFVNQMGLGKLETLPTFSRLRLYTRASNVFMSKRASGYSGLDTKFLTSCIIAFHVVLLVAGVT